MPEVATTRAKMKAEKESEVQRVYRVLKSWLIETKLAPGEFLSEVDLAARCKTSRTPVREAFNRLAQDSWLLRIPRKGYLVRPISVRDIVQLYEYRKILECFAVEKAAQSANHEQVEELRAIVSVEKGPASQLAAILEANSKFHLRLAQLAGNERVVSQMSLALNYVRRLDTICTQKMPGWISHDEIMRALRTHKPHAAKQAMARHIDLSREKMLTLFST